MGLPEILIEFKSRAVSAIKRSEGGIVALILKDDTQEKDIVTLKDIGELEEDDWNDDNYDYIKMALDGTPSKLIVIRIDPDGDYKDGLKKLENKNWNYLAVPGLEGSANPDSDNYPGDDNYPSASEDVEEIASWIKSKRKNDGKTFKAVLSNSKSDNEGIINFTTTGINDGDREYTTAEYTTRIAGVLAGIPFTRSATYYKLNDLESIDELEKDDADDAIDNGKLILINDGESIKIGRGVNSLTETTTEKTEDFKSIRIVEVMDMIYDDIKNTFDDEYIGKVSNTYDNQVLFFNSVNAYFAVLEGDDILDSNYDNNANVDLKAQELAWQEKGENTNDWDEKKIKDMTFSTKVFASANIKIIETMEDLDMKIHIA